MTSRTAPKFFIGDTVIYNALVVVLGRSASVPMDYTVSRVWIGRESNGWMYDIAVPGTTVRTENVLTFSNLPEWDLKLKNEIDNA